MLVAITKVIHQVKVYTLESPCGQSLVNELKALERETASEMRREPLAKPDAQHGLGPVEEITATDWLPYESRHTALNGKEPVGGK